MAELNAKLIEEAAEFLRGRIRRTPVEQSAPLSAIAGVPVWLKLEFLQTTGSFKLRGALFRLSRLTDAERRTGIATCSAGNHGKGVAYAARQMGIRAVIFVPRSIDEAKHRGMIALGAEVRVSSYPGYDETEEWAFAEAARERLPFISAFDDPAVMAGNGGTLALESMEDVPDARTFAIPVGGGGLGAGFSYAVKQRYADARIVACQHKLSPALPLSIERGEAVTRLPAVDTIAGGLEGGIGRQTFEILRSRVDDIALLSEEQIRSAMRWMLREHQYLMEPSSAVTVAACLNGSFTSTAGVLVAVCGRNVSIDVVRDVLKDE